MDQDLKGAATTVSGIRENGWNQVIPCDMFICDMFSGKN